MKEENPILTFYNTDSKEEVYFYWWILDCMKEGLIKKFWYQPKTYILMDSIFLPFRRKKIKVVNDDKYHLFNNWEYTPDFVIEWNGENLLHFEANSNPECKILPTKRFPFISQKPGCFSWVDIKGEFAGTHNNSAITFPYNQRMMYYLFFIYVNKIIVPRIFKKTFTPERYLWTDAKTKMRIIHFTIITIEQYLKSKI